MTVKHTPGPWVACDNIHPEIHIAAKNAVVARGIYPDIGGVGRANAKLIAAAPALADGADIVARQDVTAAIAFLLMNGEKPPGCDSDEPERAYTLEHSYEDDARYTYPARSKLWSAVLSVGLRAAGRLP